MPVDIASEVRAEFPALVGDPGRDYIFGDAPTGTQVRCCMAIKHSDYKYSCTILLRYSLLQYSNI